MKLAFLSDYLVTCIVTEMQKCTIGEKRDFCLCAHPAPTGLTACNGRNKGIMAPIVLTLSPVIRTPSWPPNERRAATSEFLPYRDKFIGRIPIKNKQTPLEPPKSGLSTRSALFPAT
jgi:hypothetical protein